MEVCKLNTNSLECCFNRNALFWLFGNCLVWPCSSQERLLLMQFEKQTSFFSFNLQLCIFSRATLSQWNMLGFVRIYYKNIKSQLFYCRFWSTVWTWQMFSAISCCDSASCSYRLWKKSLCMSFCIFVKHKCVLLFMTAWLVLEDAESDQSLILDLIQSLSHTTHD